MDSVLAPLIKLLQKSPKKGTPGKVPIELLLNLLMSQLAPQGQAGSAMPEQQMQPQPARGGGNPGGKQLIDLLMSKLGGAGNRIGNAIVPEAKAFYKDANFDGVQDPDPSTTGYGLPNIDSGDPSVQQFPWGRSAPASVGNYVVFSPHGDPIPTNYLNAQTTSPIYHLTGNMLHAPADLRQAYDSVMQGHVTQLPPQYLGNSGFFSQINPFEAVGLGK